MSLEKRKERVLIGTRIAEKKPPLAACSPLLPHPLPVFHMHLSSICGVNASASTQQAFQSSRSLEELLSLAHLFKLNSNNSQTGVLLSHTSWFFQFYSVLMCLAISLPSRLCTLSSRQQLLKAFLLTINTKVFQSNPCICLNADIHGN